MATSNTKNYYAELSKIDIKDKTERKGQFDYLSWASAWDLLKKVHPDANRIVYEHEHTGLPIFPVNNSAQVKVGIIVNGIEHIDMLPIMDYRNKSIALESIDTMDINTAIQRSTAKAIAMHGLGLSLWIGEDVVDSIKVEPKKKAAPKATTIHTLELGDDNWVKVLKYVGENKALGLTKIVSQLKRKYNITTEVKKEIGNIVKSK